MRLKREEIREKWKRKEEVIDHGSLVIVVPAWSSTEALPHLTNMPFLEFVIILLILTKDEI